jgi:hypothetical protein
MHRNKVVEAANPGCRSHSRSGSPGEAEAVSGRFEALDMTDFSRAKHDPLGGSRFVIRYYCDLIISEKSGQRFYICK